MGAGGACRVRPDPRVAYVDCEATLEELDRIAAHGWASIDPKGKDHADANVERLRELRSYFCEDA